MLASTSESVKGMTAHAARAGPIASRGAMKKRYRLAPVGTTISLNKSLATSANGCSNPNGPTRLGPMRTCMKPITLRSASVKYATERINGIAIAMIFTSVHTTIHTGPSHCCTGARNSMVKRAPP